MIKYCKFIKFKYIVHKGSLKGTLDFQQIG